MKKGKISSSYMSKWSNCYPFFLIIVPLVSGKILSVRDCLTCLISSLEHQDSVNLHSLKEKRVLKQCPWGTILEHGAFFCQKGHQKQCPFGKWHENGAPKGTRLWTIKWFPKGTVLVPLIFLKCCVKLTNKYQIPLYRLLVY